MSYKGAREFGVESKGQLTPLLNRRGCRRLKGMGHQTTSQVHARIARNIF